MTRKKSSPSASLRIFLAPKPPDITKCRMTKNSTPQNTVSPQTAAQRFAATRSAMGADAFDAMTAQEPDDLPAHLHKDPGHAALRRRMPWIADLARMEQYAAESLHMPAQAPLDPAGLEQAARDPMQLNVYVQPHLRLLRSGWDIPAIWQAVASGEAPPTDAAESFTAIYNDNGHAAVWSLNAPAYAVLENLVMQPSFALAAAAALRIEPSFALDRFLAMLVQQGLLAQEWHPPKLHS